MTVSWGVWGATVHLLTALDLENLAIARAEIGEEGVVRVGSITSLEPPARMDRMAVEEAAQAARQPAGVKEDRTARAERTERTEEVALPLGAYRLRVFGLQATVKMVRTVSTVKAVAEEAVAAVTQIAAVTLVVAVEVAEVVGVAVELAERAALEAEALSGSSSMKAVRRFVTM
jgi:hypothetical protein